MAHTRKKERVQFASPAGKHRSVRRCAWTRESYPKDELIRLVLDPSGCVFVDVLGRGAGRGVYICPNRDVVAAALSPKGLAKIFRGQARALGFAPKAEHERISDGETPQNPFSPSEYIAQLVLDRAVELIALARRAGQLEVGTDIVLQGLKKNISGSLLVLAHDLSPRTAHKVREQVRSDSVRVRVFGSKDHFGEALGRGSTGVLYCVPGNLADRIAAEGIRLASLSDLPDDDRRQISQDMTKAPKLNSFGVIEQQTGIQAWTRTNNAHLVGVGENESTVGKPGDLNENVRAGATRYSD